MKETAAAAARQKPNRRHGKVRVAVPSQALVGSPPPARDAEEDGQEGADARAGGGEEVGRPAENMQELRHQLKYARVGTGDIAAAFYACTFKVGAKGFTMLIVTCRRSGRWKKALEIFETMRGGGVWGVKPNFYTYSALISVCCNAGACNKAIDIVRDMIYAATSGTDPGIEPDVGIFRVVMTACSRHERHKSVLELHRVMTQGNIPQDEAITTCVLTAFLALSNCRGALEAVHELWAMGAQVDQELCVGLLATAATQEGLQFVVEVFLTLQMGGVEISPELCHPVMVAVRAAGHAEMGLMLLEEMQAADLAVKEETYNELLWTLATNGECEDALKVYHQMKERRVRIDDDTCKAMLKCCEVSGELDRSSKLTHEFLRMGVCPRKEWMASSSSRASSSTQGSKTKDCSSVESGFLDRSVSSCASSVDWAFGADTSFPAICSRLDGNERCLNVG